MSRPATDARFRLATADRPGGVAIIDLHGPGVTAVLEALTGRTAPPPHTLRLARLPMLDDVLIAVLRHDHAQLMPHGGPGVVRALADQLIAHGAARDDDHDASARYPEAPTPIDADVLAAVATAASPAAIALLADQPGRWRDWFARGMPAPQIDPRCAPLRHLLTPPTVAVIGRPNAGKSTLLNALLGTDAALVADLPGTTRDWLGGVVELPVSLPWRDGHGRAHLAVRWLDTPGFRDTDDPVERAAIAAARAVLREADVLIALRAPGLRWPDPDDLPRRPDLHVLNKADLPADAPDWDDTAGPRIADLAISAKQHDHLDALADAVAAALGLHAVPPEPRWACTDALQAPDTNWPRHLHG